LYHLEVLVTDDGVPPLADTKPFSVKVRETNSAPILALVANQMIDEGSTLLVTNTAFDPDGLGQSLTFSLAPGAPEGMTVGRDTGILSWTPSETQGPDSYLITVHVTDNGEPPASSAVSFGVTVNEVNAAPVLAPIPGQTNHLGGTFQAVLRASDSDWPANALTFSLQDTPIGVTLEGALISWTPAPWQVPSTNGFLVVVRDDGSPARSAVQQVTWVVLPPLEITSLTRQGTNATLRWSSIPGHTYRIQSAPSIDNPAWTDFGEAITASSAEELIAFPMTEDRRFFRVVAAP
jgi:hypothetical protein